MDFKKIWSQINKETSFYTLYVSTPRETKVVSINDNVDDIKKSCDELNEKFVKNRKYFPGYYAYVKKANSDIYTKFPEAQEIIRAITLDYVIAKDAFKNQWKEINKREEDEREEPEPPFEDPRKFRHWIVQNPFRAYKEGESIDTIIDVLREEEYSEKKIESIVNDILDEAEEEGYIRDEDKK